MTWFEGLTEPGKLEVRWTIGKIEILAGMVCGARELEKEREKAKAR